MAVAPATIDTMQGLTFSFNSIEFRATNIKRKESRPLVEVSDCSQAVDSLRVFQAEPLKQGDEISLEYFGKNPPTKGTKYAISCTGLGITGNAFCTDVEEGGSVGEYVKGTATFKITG
jgi:hypothetical protein